MPINANFTLLSAEDGNLTMGLTPPAPVGGQYIEFTMSHRFGGTPFVTKSVASGYNAVSGITIVNSGTGIISINLTPTDVSGVDPGVKAYRITRLDSGQVTAISQGYRLMEV